MKETKGGRLTKRCKAPWGNLPWWLQSPPVAGEAAGSLNSGEHHCHKAMTCRHHPKQNRAREGERVVVP